LIDRLIGHLTSPDYTYWHSYRPGDVIAWDNWRTNHAAAGSKVKYNRTMWRTTIKGNVAIGQELGPAVAPSVRNGAFTEAAH
jgi:taurine dioxygenase